jgi:outer membrane protein insertion porin family
MISFKFIKLIFFILFFPKILLSYEIIIEGNEKLSLNDLQTLTSINLSKENYDQFEINKLVQDFYDSNLIFDYTLIFEEKTALINLQESRVIENIFINNNLYIEDDNIKKNLSSKVGALLNKNSIAIDIKNIQKLYNFSGYSEAYITSSIENYSKDRANLIFTINEGDSSKISKINFKGNNFFSHRYLKNIIFSDTVSPFNIFAKGSNLDSSVFTFDTEKISNEYKKYGFNNVNVTYTLNKRNNYYDLTFNINEGDRLKIDQTDYSYISNNLSMLFERNFNEFNNELKKQDYFFNEKLIKKYLNNFNNLLIDKNILDSSFTYVLSRVNQLTNINFIEKKSDPIYVNKVNIEGNVITKDKIIRSKILFEPGDTVNSYLIDQTNQNLNKLRYINKVKISENYKTNGSDFSIQIDENKKTGSVLFGGSFSGDTGFGLNFNIKDINFQGSGNELNTSFNFNSERTLFNISYMQYPLSLPTTRNKYSIYNIETDLTDSYGFKSKKYGVGYDLLFDINKDVMLSTGIELYNEDNYAPYKSIQAVSDNIGNVDYLKLNLNLIRDTTNDIFNPTSGSLNSIKFSIRNDDNSVNSNYIITANNNFYKSFGMNDSFIFFLNDLGYADSFKGNVKTINTFSLGGNNFKGFDYRGIGPFQDGIYLGGNNLITSTIGYGDNFIFDEKDNVIIKVFYSAGSIWGSDYINNDDFKLRSSIGLSLDFLSVIPISFNYAIPLEKELTDKERLFNFQIGTTF